MAGGAYRVTSLDPRYTKLYVKTNRRIYLQNLINLLHASLHKRDAVRAYRSWAILMRCPEIDFRSTWKWALPVLDLVESSQDLPTLTSDNDRENDSGPSGSGPSRLRLIKDGLKGSAKETYLKRMLVAAHQWQKPEILTSLVVHLLSQQLYEEALDELDLYLPSFPFALSAIIHTYAGLVLFYLAQPRKTYPSAGGGAMASSQFMATQHYPSSSPMRGPSGQLDAFSSLHLMDDDDEDEGDDPLRGQARRRAELKDWDAGRLRKALVMFNKAVDIEKEEERDAAEKALARARATGDESLGVIRRAVGGSVARGFVKEIKSMLLIIDGRIDDDADSSADEEKAGWSEEEPEEPEEDDKMDDKMDDSDDEDEEDEENETTGGIGDRRLIVIDNRSPVPSTPGTPVHQRRRRSGSKTPTISRLANKSGRKTPMRTPTRSPYPSSMRSSPDATPTGGRSMRTTRNPQPMYQTSAHPIDAMDDQPAPLRQEARRLMSSDSSDGDDYRETSPGEGNRRRGTSASGRGIKRKSRSRSRSRSARSRSRPVVGGGMLFEDRRSSPGQDYGDGVEHPDALDERSEYSEASIG